jgi:plasmid maintenance system antidote protein VapI
VTTNKMETDYAVAPGSHLEEWAEENNRSLDDLHEHLGIPKGHARAFLNGGHVLSWPMAEALEALTGISAGHWSRLDHNYRTDLDVIATRLREDFDDMANGWFWSARFEDTVGGWCIQPSWDRRTSAQGGIVLVSLVPTEQLAHRIAWMHNSTLWSEPKPITREVLDETWRVVQLGRAADKAEGLDWT